jgi:hypothetical protein
MLETLHALQTAELVFQLVVFGAVTGYALTRGGPRVLGPALLNVVCWIVGGIFLNDTKHLGPSLIISCASDAVVAFGLLYFTLRYDSAWLGLGVVAQGLQLPLDAFSIVPWHDLPLYERVMLNVLGAVLTDFIQIGILGFAITERRRTTFRGGTPLLRPS